MGESLTQLVNTALAQGQGGVFFLAFAAGVLMSFSPCTLALLPVLVGYIGGYGPGEKKQGFVLPAVFALGLATTFAILGVAAAWFGSLFGQIGHAWTYIVAAVALLMGLNLLGVITLRFPALRQVPAFRQGYAGAFGVGLFFGLVASPCTTPVLAVLVTYVSSRGQIPFGSLLLFAYGLGHGVPLVLAGTFTAFIRRLPALRRYGHYVTYASGLLLLGFGFYLLVQARW